MSRTFAQLLLMLLSTTNTGEILNFFNIIVIKFLETRETNNHFSYFSRSVNLFSFLEKMARVPGDWREMSVSVATARRTRSGRLFTKEGCRTDGTKFRILL
jgi:hypothetical protein